MSRWRTSTATCTMNITGTDTLPTTRQASLTPTYTVTSRSPTAMRTSPTSTTGTLTEPATLGWERAVQGRPRCRCERLA